MELEQEVSIGSFVGIKDGKVRVIEDNVTISVDDKTLVPRENIVVKQDEQYFSRDEMSDIIQKAESLRQYDDSQIDVTSIVQQHELGQSVTLDDLHAIAKGINIPTEFVDDVVLRFYPSKSQQLQFLDNHNVAFSPEMQKILHLKLVSTYYWEIIAEIERWELHDNKHNPGKKTIKGLIFPRIQTSFLEDPVYTNASSLVFRENKWRGKEFSRFNFKFYNQDRGFTMDIIVKAFNRDFFMQISPVVLKLKELYEDMGILTDYQTHLY